MDKDGARVSLKEACVRRCSSSKWQSGRCGEVDASTSTAASWRSINALGCSIHLCGLRPCAIVAAKKTVKGVQRSPGCCNNEKITGKRRDNSMYGAQSVKVEV